MDVLLIMKIGIVLWNGWTKLRLTISRRDSRRLWTEPELKIGRLDGAFAIKVVFDEQGGCL